EGVLVIHDRGAEVGGAAEFGAIEELAFGIDREAAVIGAPDADRIEVFEREADGIHQLVARRAGFVLAVLLHALAPGDWLFVVSSLLERRYVGRRRRRRGAEQNFHDVLATLHW